MTIKIEIQTNNSFDHFIVLSQMDILAGIDANSVANSTLRQYLAVMNRLASSGINPAEATLQSNFTNNFSEIALQELISELYHIF